MQRAPTVSAILIMLIAVVMLFNLGKGTETSRDTDANTETEAWSILATPGAGVWEQVKGLRPVENLLAIAFAPDGRLGVAIGGHGELVETYDGGATWNVRSAIPLGELSVATCVTAPEFDRILFGTSVDEDWPAGTIYELQPEGGMQKRVWQGEYGGLLAVSRNGRFWAGEDCFILRADTTGFTPIRLPSCDGKVIYDIEAAGSLVLAVGMNGLLAISRDEGNTWTASQLKPSVALESEPLEIHRVATNGHLAIAGGNYGGLWRSEDAGETWAPVRGLGKRMNVWALHLTPNGLAGFAGGGDSDGGAPFILATGDGGKTFMPEPIRGASGRIMGIARGESSVFAVSFDGRVLVRHAIP